MTKAAEDQNARAKQLGLPKNMLSNLKLKLQVGNFESLPLLRAKKSSVSVL